MWWDNNFWNCKNNNPVMPFGPFGLLVCRKQSCFLGWFLEFTTSYCQSEKWIGNCTWDNNHFWYVKQYSAYSIIYWIHTHTTYPSFSYLCIICKLLLFLLLLYIFQYMSLEYYLLCILYQLFPFVLYYCRWWKRQWIEIYISKDFD